MTLIKKLDAAPFSTPNAQMIGYASPSRGAAELSTWQFRMEPGASGPVHLVDREQVYWVLDGTVSITIGEQEHQAGVGDTVIVPPGAQRQVLNQGSGPAMALVCMPAGGRVTTLDGEDRGVVPWAS